VLKVFDFSQICSQRFLSTTQLKESHKIKLPHKEGLGRAKMSFGLEQQEITAMTSKPAASHCGGTKALNAHSPKN